MYITTEEVLNSYEQFSGQAVNYQKSAVFFSSNVRRDKQLEIKQILGVYSDIGESKYLGLPSLIGRSKKTVFRYLKDKIFQRIQSWSSKLLSRAGKAVMIRNVAQSIPSYTMSCFMIPKTLCQEIERLMNAFWWKSSSSSSKGIRWCAWDKMSMSKKRGGLGFRDLHGFNVALLGKQCWNLITKPDSLAARVLKARYYPNCSLLQASRGGGVSYTWSGLWEAKEEMKRDLRWVLGDGQTINISTDKWLRNKEGLCVDQASATTGTNMKVCDFFKEDTKSWDEQKVRSHFNNADANAILNTRIPQVCIRDRIAWSHSHNGQYTVKSGYQQWHKNHVDIGGVQQSRGWSRIWSVQVPHRVRIFLWRFCRNNVPIRHLLRGRGIMISRSCMMCTGDIEHLRHLFIECDFAKECWQRVGLEYDFTEVEDAAEWLLNKLSDETEENLVKIASVLWGLWFARNKKIFEDKQLSSSVAMAWSQNQIAEWRRANRKVYGAPGLRTNESQRNQCWKPPSLGTFKINVDAAVKTGQNFFAVGMVLRDSQGQFVAGRAMRFAGNVQVVEAEMVGIVEALSWLNHLPIAAVEVESDSQLCVNAINGECDNILELGLLVKQCKLMIRNRGGVSVGFVRKRANKVAHAMAKFPCELNSFFDFQSPPSFLLETLLSDTLLI